MPVCVSPHDREASKSNAVCWPFIAPCCGFIPSDAPSPLRTPEDSQTYEHISRSILPVSVRPVSGEDDPAWSPAPVQARKGERRGKNPFLFAMLFEKNIEIFSAPNPSVLCVFSICLPRFRAWTGSVGSAGTHHDAGLPEISGAFGVRGTMIIDNSIIEANGAFRITETSYDVNYASFQVSSNLSSQGCTFYASRNNVIYGSSPTVMPASVNLPAILYLGEQS